MHLSDYSAGIYRQQLQYRSFLPTPVNDLWQWADPRIDTLLAEANRRLGELNGLSLIVPDLDQFIQMHVVKEAQTSSRIEGTQTGLEEAVQDDPEEIDPEKRDDWQEVRRYIAAMNNAIDGLSDLPLSNRLLRDAHRTLLSGVRGEHRTPGEFRHSQNWIGGTTIADAVFVPPHHEDVPDLMGDLEAFWHNDQIEVPHLIRVAISHYQFETIHPFQDGNGRIGRLLITLYLVSMGILQHPSLYISAHLEENRAAYYDALSRVRESNDMGHWLRFFLVAVIETAKQSTATFKAIFELRLRLAETLKKLGRRAPNAEKLVNYLYRKPVVTSREITGHLGFSQTTSDRLLAELSRLGILRELTGRRRNRVFNFKDYFELFLK